MMESQEQRNRRLITTAIADGLYVEAWQLARKLTARHSMSYSEFVEQYDVES